MDTEQARRCHRIIGAPPTLTYNRNSRDELPRSLATDRSAQGRARWDAEVTGIPDKLEDITTDRDILCRYVFVKTLRRGGFGVVQQYREKISRRDFALKVADVNVADAYTRDKICQEALLMDSLVHNNLPRTVKVFADAFSPVIGILTEYCAGGDLRTAMEIQRLVDHRKKPSTSGRPSTPQFHELHIGFWAWQLASALAYLHPRGVVHRDVQPANVFLTRKGLWARQIIKLGDLGLAKVMPFDKATHGHTAIGTMTYMSPEMLTREREYRAQTDLWSLGCVVFELATWELAFSRLPDIRSGRLPWERVLYSDEELTPQVRQLCSLLLSPHPPDRGTAMELEQRNEFLTKCSRFFLNDDRSLKPSGDEELGLAEARLGTASSIDEYEARSVMARAPDDDREQYAAPPELEVRDNARMSRPEITSRTVQRVKATRGGRPEPRFAVNNGILGAIGTMTPSMDEGIGESIPSSLTSSPSTARSNQAAEVLRKSEALITRVAQRMERPYGHDLVSTGRQCDDHEQYLRDFP